MTAAPASAPTSAPAKPAAKGFGISDEAAARLKKLLLERQTPEAGLRVSVKGGGCSGLTYMLEFEDTERKGDRVIEEDGVKIFMDIKSQLFLAGTTLDYTKSLMDTGFKFVNPNAKRSCSCGESFSV